MQGLLYNCLVFFTFASAAHVRVNSKQAPETINLHTDVKWKPKMNLSYLPFIVYLHKSVTSIDSICPEWNKAFISVMRFTCVLPT